MIRRSLSGGLLLALVAAACSVAGAQANPDSVRHRNECRLASQVVERAVPDAKRVWAHAYIRSCKDPDSQAAILGALARLRTSTDTTAVHAVMAILAQVRDGAIFSSMLAIAGDRSASIQARVIAFVRFSTLLTPDAVGEYKYFINGLDVDGNTVGPCNTYSFHGDVPFENGYTPMPTDYRRQIIAVARRVRDDPTEPMHVRSAAACVS